MSLIFLLILTGLDLNSYLGNNFDLSLTFTLTSNLTLTVTITFHLKMCDLEHTLYPDSSFDLRLKHYPKVDLNPNLELYPYPNLYFNPDPNLDLHPRCVQYSDLHPKLEIYASLDCES